MRASIETICIILGLTALASSAAAPSLRRRKIICGYDEDDQNYAPLHEVVSCIDELDRDGSCFTLLFGRSVQCERDNTVIQAYGQRFPAHVEPCRNLAGALREVLNLCVQARSDRTTWVTGSNEVWGDGDVLVAIQAK